MFNRTPVLLYIRTHGDVYSYFQSAAVIQTYADLYIGFPRLSALFWCCILLVHCCSLKKFCCVRLLLLPLDSGWATKSRRYITVNGQLFTFPQTWVWVLKAEKAFTSEYLRIAHSSPWLLGSKLRTPWSSWWRAQHELYWCNTRDVI